MVAAAGCVCAMPAGFRCRVWKRSVGVRATDEGAAAGSEDEKKKTRKTGSSRAKKSGSLSSGKSVARPSAAGKKTQQSGDESAGKVSSKSSRPRKQEKRDKSAAESGSKRPELGFSEVMEEEQALSVAEEAELRKKLYPPKTEKLWKKPFPWLGREFEETFVKPRNEPNPLVCCFGEVINEFIPSVRVCIKQMDEDAYSTWKGLQWTPPEFARSPGTNPANVAISIARLAGKSAFIGKVGDDELGRQLIQTLEENKVDTKGVKFDPLLQTSLSRGKLVQQGKRGMSMHFAQESAESSLDISEVDMDIIKEAKLFHFSSISLTTDKMRSTVLSAVEAARGFGSIVFFDVNLPLPFWISRDDTWEAIEKAWTSSDVIKLNKVELEFLIEDEGLGRRVLARDTIAKSWEEFQSRKNDRCEYHYTLEDIAPIWRDNIKILFVTDGTYRIHYYTPKFHGDVNGTEDVIVAAFSCDRTGSGDTISAAMIRKLTAQPDIFEDQDRLERALRFVIAAGVISQWTIGAVRGFPTESAAQNLTEQMFPLTQI